MLQPMKVERRSGDGFELRMGVYGYQVDQFALFHDELARSLRMRYIIFLNMWS